MVIIDKKGGVTMATSSIFQNIILKKRKDVKRFAEAIEASEKCNNPIKKTNSKYVTDKKEIREFVEGMLKANA